jgi:flagellar hook-length control protein FliK
MNLTPLDISARPSSTSTLETSPLANEKEFKTVATEFGAVMNTLLAKHANLTAQALVTVGSEEAVSATDSLSEEALTDMLNLSVAPVTPGEAMVLTAFHLGPHLQIITPESAAPEGQSLEVFARSQGLDEAALQWLMGKSSAPITTSTAPTSPTSAAVPSLSASVSATIPAIPTLPTSAAPPTSAATPTGSTGPTAPISTTAPTGPSGPTALSRPDLPVSVLPANTAPQAEAPSELRTALAALELSTPLSSRTVIATEAFPHGGLVKANPLGPEDAAQWDIPGQKHPPASDLMKGASPLASTASDWLQSNTLAVNLVKPIGNNKADATPAPLDLSALLSADMQDTLETMAMDGFASGQESSSQGQGQGSFNGRPDPNHLGRNESTPNTSGVSEQDSAQRRENIHNLAEKMGQAVGQRILSELERGQWHLKLSLRPATLGHIEVEMRMRSGEMDAVFTAPQALTRELLNEGISKLRDTLNQMGMDVASLKVDDGQGRQRGGESTPERQAQVKDNTPTESADVPTSPTVAAPNKMGTDGWDVLV